MDSSDLPERIAKVALDHYSNVLPTKGKPKENEWTVFAAIVASSSINSSGRQSPCWVVSSATGTKCTAERSHGNILHDSHAEVLARRGLVRCLWTEICSMNDKEPTLSNTSKMLLEPSTNFDSTKKDDESSPLRRTFRLKSTIQLHMYISDSPCGDASIYDIGGGGLQFTGAKLIVTKDTQDLLEKSGGHVMPGSSFGREKEQLLGKLRIKSSRSNLEESRRSCSMSCSDKLVRWGVLGLQGRLISSLILEPIVLSSVVISQDPRVKNTSDQLQALERAVSKRILSTLRVCQTVGSAPSIYICDSTFPKGKACMEAERTPEEPPRKRQRGETSNEHIVHISPSGICTNWIHCEEATELIVGARGVRQGKKPKSHQDQAKLRSRLSRASLFQFARNQIVAGEGDDSLPYEHWKRKLGTEKSGKLKSMAIGEGPLDGWLVESGRDHIVLEIGKHPSS